VISNKWLKHALRRNPWRNQRQAFALAALGFFVALIIGALYLSQSVTVATTGRQLEGMILERNQLEQANEQLRAEIASLRSVPRLQQRARELGFELANAGDIEYLVVEGYDPNEDRAPIALEIALDTVPTYDETFVGWLRQQLDAFSSQLNQQEE
jgi:cell division protein FtsB